MSRRPASSERSVSADRPLRLLWLGSYESDYPRNRVLISGLSELGVDVVECHAPIWERQRHKVGAFLRPGNLLATARALVESWVRLGREQSRLGRFDAVVLGYPSQPDILFGWAVARRRRAPLVIDGMLALSDVFSSRGLVGPGAHALALVDRLLFGRADVVVADTDANRVYLAARFGLGEPHVAAVPVGADPDIFAPAPLAADPGHALFVGKLAPLHGVDVVLEAARMPGTPPVRIIGSGQLDGWLADELERNPPSGVSHVPWVPFEQLGDEIRAASICLGVFAPSERVGRVVPNKVWQAMAVGRPIITADGPAPREVLENGRSALLVPPGDAGALADALRKLGEDADLRRALSAAARRRYIEVGAPARVAERLLTGIGRGPNVPV